MADRYWVGGTGNWNSAAEWSTSSGGAGGASVPTATDNAIFDANSFTAGGLTCTITAGAVCKDLRILNIANNPTFTFADSGGMGVYGDMHVNSGLTLSITTNSNRFIHLEGNSVHELDCNNVSINARFILEGGYTRLISALDCQGLTDSGGLEFDTRGYALTVYIVIGLETITTNFRTSVVTLNDITNSIISGATNDIYAEQATINYISTDANTEFSGGPMGLTLEYCRVGALNGDVSVFNNILLMDNAIVDEMVISGMDEVWPSFDEGFQISMTNSSIGSLLLQQAGSFSEDFIVDILACDDSFIGSFDVDVAATEEAYLRIWDNTIINELNMTDRLRLEVDEDYNLTVNDIKRNGGTGLCYIRSFTLGSQATLVLGNKTINVNGIAFRDIQVNGLGELYAGEDSFDEGNVDGVIFTAPQEGHRQKGLDISIIDEDGFRTLDSEQIVKDISVVNAINELPQPVTLEVKVSRDMLNNKRELYGLAKRAKFKVAGPDTTDDQLVYLGSIQNIQNDYNQNSVKLTVHSDASVLDKHILKALDTEDAEQATATSYRKFTDNFHYVFPITTGAAITQLSQIKLRLMIYSFLVSTVETVLSVHSSLSSAQDPDDPGLVTVEKRLVGDDYRDYYYRFAEALTVTPSTVYYVRVSQNETPYASAFYFRGVASGTSYEDDNYDGSFNSITFTPVYTTYTPEEATTVPFASQDAADVIREILTAHQAQGGLISHNAYTLNNTGVIISYTFNMATCLEGIMKVMEFLPPDWYWYIDPATDLFHLHQADLENAQHELVSSKHITELNDEISSENINTVAYFTGGDTGGGTILFKKYVDPASAEEYGQRVARIQDGRVIVEGTADDMIDAQFDKDTVPKFRLSGKILDDNAMAKGYDTESVKPGDSVRVVGADDGEVPRYDVAEFDVDYFDYDLYKLGSIIVTVVRVEYTPLFTLVHLGSDLTRINAAIQGVRRDVIDVETIDNPTEPLT